MPAGMFGLDMEREEAKQFISQLKPGDRVQLTYGEALAIAGGAVGRGVRST